MNPSTLVIISYWSERSINPLKELISQMDIIDSGTSFDSLIVCNGFSNKVENLINQSNLSHNLRVVSRPNHGFNIGAWDYGWRCSPNYHNFLFLQDDCIIFRKNWLKAFINKFNDNNQIGLLGESINWHTSWDELSKSDYNNYHKGHTLSVKKMRRIDLYRAYLSKNLIPEGLTADHLQTLVLFTSKQILEQIKGFSIGESYGEAIASEIAISKKVQSAGYEIAMVNPHSCFHYIGHPQWLKRRRKIQQFLYWVKENIL